MGAKQIINIINASLIAILIAVVIILSCVIGNLQRDKITLMQEKNYLSQTIDKMKAEEIIRNDIITKQNELLEEVRRAKTMKDYVVVWEKINKELSK